MHALEQENKVKLNVPVPDSTEEMIGLLNGSEKSSPNLSWRIEPDNTIRLFTGDQSLVLAQDWAALRIFLLGMFVSEWSGNSLEYIRERAGAILAERRAAQIEADQAAAAVAPQKPSKGG